MVVGSNDPRVRPGPSATASSTSIEFYESQEAFADALNKAIGVEREYVVTYDAESGGFVAEPKE